tara:strand:+ start:1169 stop:1378 length:210 start_codon:yes stop_codon:yes gene_type:complete
MELLTLGGYGHFVWPAFIFTFFVCLALYLKTKKEFKKQEKIFLNEFENTHLIKIKEFKGKRVLSNEQIF